MKTAVIKSKGFIDFPCALGSDVATSIEMAAKGVANTQEILFSFTLSSVQLSSSLKHLKEKMKAITELFEWLKTYPLPKATNKYQELYLTQMTANSWNEKCAFDYYNQVIRNVKLLQLPSYLKEAKLVTTKQKSLMAIKYIKDHF